MNYKKFVLWHPEILVELVLLLKGEVTEWLKVHAWKACVPQKGTGGSNPFLSAKNF
jgi:hypothetical protein